MTQLFEYPFESNYAHVGRVRLHYLGEGQGAVKRFVKTTSCGDV